MPHSSEDVHHSELKDNMVKFRGIDVSIVSQFDIRKLPEFSPCESHDPFQQAGPTLRSNDRSVASCYVPIYPGSQIWFEYSVDAPHPPNASYFFKMLHNGQVVTSWDCTAKHGYCGKMTHNIQYIGNENLTGMPLIQRQVFRFMPTEPKEHVRPFDDCIEIRIHRIEHRQRMHIDPSTAGTQYGENGATGGLCLVNGGLLEPCCPQRRYRYQLLDPTDEPYATIRFYYRSYGFLEDQNIVPLPAKPSRSTSASSSGDWSGRSASLTHDKSAGVLEADHRQYFSPRQAPSTSFTSPLNCNFQVMEVISQKDSAKPEKRILNGQYPPLCRSDEALRNVAKDSMEDLHASPLKIKHDSTTPAIDDVKGLWEENRAPAPPKKMLKRSLTLQIDGAGFEVEKKKIRPLSPFTSAGVLRMMSPTPPSAPAAITEFGPTVAEEVEAQLAREKERRNLEMVQVPNVGTTRVERGGHMLLGFLGKRIARAE